MWADPHVNEWVSGLMAAIVSLGLLVVLGTAIAFTAIRIWGDTEADRDLRENASRAWTGRKAS